MKRITAILLTITLLVCTFAACGKDGETENEPSGTPSQAVEYEYLYRDLPEVKYLTAASDFAGGSGTQSDPYQISDAAQLTLLHAKMLEDSENVKNNFTSAYYVLTADIAINDIADFEKWETEAPEYSWIPIGIDAVGGFSGVFDGNGYTISGLYINANNGTKEVTSTNNYGLFDSVSGTVKNVNIEKSYIAVSGQPCGVGGIAGVLSDKARVENCLTELVMNCYDASCGGIAGKASGGLAVGVADKESKISDSTVSGCTFTGKITQVRDDAMNHIGGIVGDNNGNVTSCLNKGTLSFKADSVDSVGGIAGWMSEGTISECKNEGILKCESSDEKALAIAGGIAGKVYISSIGSEKYMSRGAKITDCVNNGSVSSYMYAGGIAGQLTNDENDYCISVSGCVNNGDVAANDYTGGIIGAINCLGDALHGENILVENCENKANLTKGTVGGIIAHLMSEKGEIRIDGCTNSGNLTSEGQHCAGIIAYWIMNSSPANCKTEVKGCRNTGSITSALNAGGIISFMDMPVCLEMGENVAVSVSDCSNSAEVTTKAANGYIGGILGNWGMANVPTTVENCTNSGDLSIAADVKGISDEEAEIMTVSRIAGGIIGRVGPGLLLTTDSDVADSKNVQSESAVLRLISCANTGELSVKNEDAENYKNWFGGIIGNTCAEDGFGFFADRCSYTGFDRGLGNAELTDIGTKN